MNLLMLGDVVGAAGCGILQRRLGQIKKEYQIDMVIANGENSAEGNGILPSSAAQLFQSGVDVVTTGNHVLRRREIYEELEKANGILRPANLHKSVPGCGVYVFDALRFQVMVINLQGRVYMEPSGNPFDFVDEILEQEHPKIVAVDFHAEATAEKLAMAFHLDGRVSVVAGTHTHVQTADERVFSNGTGYITDLGMCGPWDSMLGVRADLAVKKLRTGQPVRFEYAKGPSAICGAVFSIEEASGKTNKITRLFMKD